MRAKDDEIVNTASPGADAPISDEQPRSSVGRTSGAWSRPVIAFSLALTGGLVGGLIVSEVESPGPASVALPAAVACSAAGAAEQDLPALVTITSRHGSSASVGSGDIITPGGYVLTNAHVVGASTPAGKLTVTFADGRSTSAIVVGEDVGADLAVIKVPSRIAPPSFRFGDSSMLHVGQQAIALGAPLALSGTVTSGVVSALDRSVELPSVGSSTVVLSGAVQTDASINPGNSGGALVDCAGRLIGIPAASAALANGSEESEAGSIGIGFAIPANVARAVAEEIIARAR
jgi:putative serine protease PepD